MRHKDWCTQLDSKNVKMNLRKYRKKWKNLGNKYVALENKNKFIFKKTTRKVGSGETKKSPFTHQITQAFFSPYMLHTLLNTFLKLLRYSKYWKKKKTKQKSVLLCAHWTLLSACLHTANWHSMNLRWRREIHWCLKEMKTAIWEEKLNGRQRNIQRQKNIFTSEKKRSSQQNPAV